MSPAITISYTLYPPSCTTAPAGLQASATHRLPLEIDSGAQRLRSNSHTDYYEALRNAIIHAKATLGNELTAWRDAVGDGEKDKTDGKDRKEEYDQDEGEDEEFGS